MPATPAVTLAVAASLVAAVCACSSPAPGPANGTTTADPVTTTTPAPTPTPTPPSCVDVLLAGLTPDQRAGQLLMVGAPASQPVEALDPALTDQHVGGVVLLETWTGADTVHAAVDHWQQVGQAASAGLGVLVSADQEGGEVQHLDGPGFTSTPSALEQGEDPATAGSTAAVVGGELKAAGLSVSLGPVTDTVTAAFASRNAPIGALRREYGNTPETVSDAVRTVVPALQGAGVSATLKHFPGLGRVTGNTDLTADGTTDDTTTADDAYLTPFRAGIEAGADLVMISTALYPQIDPDNRAAFSAAVVTGVLRQRIGFRGVVITDDVGAAASVAAVPVGERATRFVEAGGDIVLTALPETVPEMAAALRAKAAAEPAFSAKVDAAVGRVLDLKVRRGLAGC